MMLRRCALFLSYDGSDENGLHSGLSGKEWLRARFLSDAIPATSRAARANYINAFESTRVDCPRGGCF